MHRKDRPSLESNLEPNLLSHDIETDMICTISIHFKITYCCNTLVKKAQIVKILNENAHSHPKIDVSIKNSVSRIELV